MLDVFGKIVEVLSTSTASTEFSDACQPYLDARIIPPLATRFWFRQNPTNEDGHNHNFLFHIVACLKRHLQHGGPMFLKPPANLRDLNEKWSNHLKVQAPDWNLEDELSHPNSQIEQHLERNGLPQWFRDNGFESFFPSVVSQMDNCFHSLTTHWGFDHHAFDKDGSFLLHPCCQPPVNNRDNELPSLTMPLNQNVHDCGLFDYVVQKKLNSDSHSDLSITAAHHFLGKRVRRENVQDAALKDKLAPFTHTMKVQSGGSPYSRFTGVKVLGDPVDVVATLEDLETLFTFLTVSD